MPTSPPRRCGHCGELCKGACPNCSKWKRKPASWAAGSTREWRVFRAKWLAEHPDCMDCGAPATVVCHKPGTDYETDRCNPDAIEGQRCKECDARQTGRQGSAAQQLR